MNSILIFLEFGCSCSSCSSGCGACVSWSVTLEHLRAASSLYTCPAIILAGEWQLTKTTISSALWVVSGRWQISDAPWTRPQQATAFLENAAPQHRTPRTSANDHLLRNASSLYTCPAITLERNIQRALRLLITKYSRIMKISIFFKTRYTTPPRPGCPTDSKKNLEIFDQSKVRFEHHHFALIV